MKRFSQPPSMFFSKNEDDLKDKMQEFERTHVASPSVLKKGRLRMDAVGMTIERRLIDQMCHDPANVISGHVFTDGSPVTGSPCIGP